MWKRLTFFLISGRANCWGPIIWTRASTKTNIESSTRVDKTRYLILTVLIDDTERKIAVNEVKGRDTSVLHPVQALGNDIYVVNHVKWFGNVNVVIHHYAADVITIGRKKVITVQSWFCQHFKDFWGFCSKMKIDIIILKNISVLQWYNTINVLNVKVCSSLMHFPLSIVHFIDHNII